MDVLKLFPLILPATILFGCQSNLLASRPFVPYVEFTPVSPCFGDQVKVKAISNQPASSATLYLFAVDSESGNKIGPDIEIDTVKKENLDTIFLFEFTVNEDSGFKEGTSYGDRIDYNIAGKVVSLSTRAFETCRK